MGSSSSKAARSAAGASQRKYPTAPPSARSGPRVANALRDNATSQSPSSTEILGTEMGAGPSARPLQQDRAEREKASVSRNNAIDLDARDPHFAASLRSIGPVQPNPTFSPSSTSSVSGPGQAPSPRNTAALAILEARRRIQEDVEQERIEAGKKGYQGKKYLDVAGLRQVLVLRDEKGMPAEEVERSMGLRKGTVAKLGKQGVVEAV